MTVKLRVDKTRAKQTPPQRQLADLHSLQPVTLKQATGAVY